MGWKTVIGLAALVAGASVTVSALAARQERLAEAAHPPSGQFIDVEGHRVHAWVQGSGPDLVLIHGSTAHLGDFTHTLAGQLTDRYRVIAFDRPGLGYTPALSPDGDSLQAQAALLQKAAAQIGADAPIVLGQSLGGAVALAWATYAPDSLSALVTVSGVAQPWTTDLSTYYKILSHPLGQRLVIPILTAFVPERMIEDGVTGAFAPYPVAEGYAAHFGPRLTTRRAHLRANAMQRKNLLRDVTAQAPLYGNRITVPFELVHGLNDPVVGFQIHVPKTEAALPQVHITSLDTSGHMPHHTHQPDVIAAIDRAAQRAGLR